MHDANANCECCNGTGSPAQKLPQYLRPDDRCRDAHGSFRADVTLNASETCDCGTPKEKRMQFCKPCWEAVPETLQHRFAHAIHQLQSIVKECRLHPSQPPTASES